MSADNWKCPEDRFPVLEDRGYGKRKLTVPLTLVIAHEKQAHTNHGQTVAGLKQRGGLSWCELAAVLNDRKWFRVEFDAAHEATMRRVLIWQDQQRKADPTPSKDSEGAPTKPDAHQGERG